MGDYLLVGDKTHKMSSFFCKELLSFSQTEVSDLSGNPFLGEKDIKRIRKRLNMS